MRKRVLSLLVAIMLFVAPAFAAQEAGQFTLSPLVGGIVFEGDQQVNDDLAYGLAIGYNLSRTCTVEAAFFGANPDAEEDDVDLFTYRLDALFHLMPGARFNPYLAAGIGGYDLDEDGEFMGNYGLGVLYHLTDNIALRGDVRHLLVANESNLDHNLLYTAGLRFAFGGAKKAAEPLVVIEIPKDSDGDGVIDSSDRCPDTPKGVSVNANGCPRDSDSDAVYDYLDQCPDTPKGAPVNAKGCPLDSDADGVYDHLDKCPDTPKGIPVDAKGCPRDSDADGVYDHLDKCPNTPKGVAVDSQGCDIKISLHINFDFDKADIKPEFKDELDKAAAFIEENKKIPYVLVAGHTDSMGTDAYNQDLSKRRAEAVRQYLIEKHGVDAARIRATGYGESQPVADNETEEGRYENRRVDIICCTILPE